METQFINLNMTPTGINPCFHVSQYDIGRSLGFMIYNGSEVVDLDSYTCTIEATRSDGVAITASVATDDNVGTFETTATMTNKADKYRAQFVIVDGDSNRIASLPFDMDVVKAAMDENSESIKEDASLYQQYTETVQSTFAEVRSDLQDEENARIAADTLLDSEKINKFDTVAQMKADTTLKNGMYVETGGYYSINDGGTALYHISETEPTTHYETLTNGLYAELISDVANVKLWGAHGDGVTDDTDAIKDAINSGLPVYFPDGTYITSDTITLSINNSTFDAEKAIIKYTGNSHAFIITHSQNAVIRFGTLLARDGSGLLFTCAQRSDYVQYIDFYFLSIEAHDHCIDIIYSAGWVNEMRFYNGRFATGDVGLYCENNSTDEQNNLNFINVGVEGVNSGFVFKANTQNISALSFFGIRYQEIVNYLIETAGYVSNCTFVGNRMLPATYLNMPSPATGWTFICPVVKSEADVALGRTGQCGYLSNGTVITVNNYTGTIWGDFDNFITIGTKISNVDPNAVDNDPFNTTTWVKLEILNLGSGSMLQIATDLANEQYAYRTYNGSTFGAWVYSKSVKALSNKIEAMFPKYTGNITDTQLDAMRSNIITSGYVASTAGGFDGYGTVITMAWASSYVQQVILSSRVYTRRYTGGTWTAWS